MTAVTRLGDLCSGHTCWPPRQSIEGSGNVFVNGIPAHRRDDAWAVHCCPRIPNCHDSVLANGSPNVFTNGRPQGRIGDPVACGSSVATGSENVFANEGAR